MGRKTAPRRADSSSLVQADNSNVSRTKDLSVSSPTDWLSNIQSDHNEEGKKLSSNSPSRKSISQELRSNHTTPELQIRLQKRNSEEFKTADDNSLQNGTDISPTSCLSTTNFYGSKGKSFQFSFRKAPLDINEEEVKKKQIKNGKTGSLKRKHKSTKELYTKKQKRTVKTSKKDDQSVIRDEIKTDHKKTCNNNDDYNKDEMDKESPLSSTILDIITPESPSSDVEDHMNITTPNGILKKCTSNDITVMHQQGHKSYLKSVVDDVLLERGSLHSEDSIASGYGSIKSSTLIKGQNGEYYFSNSSENSPELTVNGRSTFFDTPKSSSNSPESEVSSTANSDIIPLLFNDVKDSDSSNYSPSWNGNGASNSVSPEHQTSITSFFKRSFKEGNDLGSPKTRKQNRMRKGNNNAKKEQMYLDLGQRNFGHVTCSTCGMVYTHAQPDDESEHIRHHKKFVNGLRFMGWKDEHVVKEFSDGRIIMVKSDDPSVHQKKAEEIRRVVDSELGFAVDLPYKKNESKTFLFIANRRVVGCCVATQIDKGYPVLPSTPTKGDTPDRQIAAWCCSTVPVPAQCGISKIWVWKQHRRKKVATRLIESVRTHFIYGCVISKEFLAFSDPTPDGKRLATAYIGTPEFLVFH